MVNISALLETNSYEYDSARDDFEYYSCQADAALDVEEAEYWTLRLESAVTRIHEVTMEDWWLTWLSGQMGE